MSRIFAYCRVSSAEQTTANQEQEIRSTGFDVKPSRVVTECISGSVQAMSRPKFSLLMKKLEQGDVLIVTKLDRLGRNAMDVRATVEALDAAGVRVHCLALGGVDLTSSAGKMTMQVLAAVAEFERDLLVERTQQGLIRAKADGKHCGRPASLTQEQRESVKHRLRNGATIASLAKEFATSRQTIMRVRERSEH